MINRFRAALARRHRACRNCHARYVPARAQWIVYDPTNFSQNVLTAARELQQINNQIQSLENQATMLIDRARTWRACPIRRWPSFEAVDHSRHEQMLAQAQNIAYSVATIDQAFTQVYPQSLFGFDIVPANRSPTRKPAGRTHAPAIRTP